MQLRESSIILMCRICQTCCSMLSNQCQEPSWKSYQAECDVSPHVRMFTPASVVSLHQVLVPGPGKTCVAPLLPDSSSSSAAGPPRHLYSLHQKITYASRNSSPPRQQQHPQQQTRQSTIDGRAKRLDQNPSQRDLDLNLQHINRSQSVQRSSGRITQL